MKMKKLSSIVNEMPVLIPKITNPKFFDKTLVQPVEKMISSGMYERTKYKINHYDVYYGYDQTSKIYFLVDGDGEIQAGVRVTFRENGNVQISSSKKFNQMIGRFMLRMYRIISKDNGKCWVISDSIQVLDSKKEWSKWIHDPKRYALLVKVFDHGVEIPPPFKDDEIWDAIDHDKENVLVWMKVK